MVSAKDKRDGELADLHWLMADARGRRIVLRILDECGVFKTVLRPQPLVPPEYVPWFNSGKQNVGQWMMGEAQTFYPGWQAMNEEQYTKRINEEESKKKGGKADDEANPV